VNEDIIRGYEVDKDTYLEVTTNIGRVPFGSAQFSHFSDRLKSLTGRAHVPPGTSLRKV
jgi:hypothetical protein